MQKMKTDYATILGITYGVTLIFVAILSGGAGMGPFWSWQALFIVLGGTLGATLINFPITQLVRVFGVLRVVFTRKSGNAIELISTMTVLADKARRQGVLSLEEDVKKTDDEFLQKGFQLLIDGTKPEVIKEILTRELSFRIDRHRAGRSILLAMSIYSPAFGMIGTLIGLIKMLRNLGEADKIGPGMAVALITTFYGIFLAYLVFLPVAGKLEEHSNQEIIKDRVILEGIQSIQAGDNPRILEERMISFLEPKLREKIISKRGQRVSENVRRKRTKK